MAISGCELADLYRHQSAALRRHLSRKLGDDTQAEDLMHEVYLRLLSAPAAAPTLRCQKAYLFTIASNLAIDTLRHNQRTRKLFTELPDDEHERRFDGTHLGVVSAHASLEEQTDASARLEQVLRALDSLPANCRSAFILHKLLDCSYAEVASRLDVSVSMVEKHLSRALAHLRQLQVNGEPAAFSRRPLRGTAGAASSRPAPDIHPA